MLPHSDNSIGLGVFLAYGILILLYLIILRLLLNLLQQMGDKHIAQRSVIDRDIHRTMTNHVETSMHAFDAYNIAIVIVKGGISAIAMAAIIVLLVIKFGFLATGVLIVIVVTVIYAVDHWLKSREKPGSFRAEVRKYVQKAGSVGTIIMLSILLVVLLFVMTFISV
jgi:hypothetical protein